MLSKPSSSSVGAIIAGTTAAGADLDIIGAATHGVAVSVGVAVPGGTAGAAVDRDMSVGRAEGRAVVREPDTQAAGGQAAIIINPSLSTQRPATSPAGLFYLARRRRPRIRSEARKRRNLR